MKAFVFMIATAMAAVAAPIVGASAAQAAPLTQYNITFDGYCDGLSLNLPSVGLPGTAYAVDGDRTGCESGGIFGTAKPNRFGAYGVKKGSEYMTDPTYSTHIVVNRNHTWVYYGLSGNLIYVSNSGTWTAGTPAAARGKSSITARAGVAKPLHVTGAKDIAFDGFCDGMHLVSPSAGLGTKGTVDGNATGCATDALMGSKSTIGGAKGTYAVSILAGGSTWLQYVIFANHTWALFYVSGDQIGVGNSGTWSAGVPQAGAPRSSAA